MSETVKPVNYLLPITFRRHQRVTAGVLDERAESAFTCGQCFSLAYALMELLDDDTRSEYTVHFLTQVDEAGERKEYFIHAYLVASGGVKFDAMGIDSAEGYVGEWSSRYANYATFRVDIATWGDMLAWQNNWIASIVATMPKQRFDAARVFAPAVWDRVVTQAVSLGCATDRYWD